MTELRQPEDGDFSAKGREQKDSPRLALIEAMKAGEKFIKLPDDSPEKEAVRGRHVERIQKFLDFQVLPEPGAELDYIVVATTSPDIDIERYHSRIDKGVELTKEYQDARIIFAGNIPDASRRTGQEDMSEAEHMYLDALRMGVDDSRIVVEGLSNHLKENVEFSIREVINEINETTEFPLEVGIVSSQSTIRRAYYCALQLMDIEFKEYRDKIKLYFIASDKDVEDPEFAFYEMRRLLEYRSKGWL